MDTKALRQKVLDLAIRGKLVPQDPNDEPASVLLERIRAEKQRLVKEGKLKAKDIKNDTIIFVGDDNLHYEKFADGSVKCIEDEILFELPEGWFWERLSNMALFSGGKTPSTSKREYWGNEMPWVTSKDMKSKYITGSQLMLSSVGAELMQVYQPDTLLLVTRSGILRHTLPVAILKVDATVNQDLKAISLYLPELAEYVYICFKGMESHLLSTYAKSGTTVENINFDEFSHLLLPIPGMNLIERIQKAVASAEEQIDLIEHEKEGLVNTVASAKSKILDMAIRGQLVPHDPADEPASALLERIRTEKEELIKQGKIKRDKKESIIFRGDDNSYYRRSPDGEEEISDDLPYAIPDSWEWTTIGELFAINPRNKIADDMDVSFIPMPLIDDGYSGYHRSETKQWKDVKTGFTHFQNGDIGLAKITPCFENRKSVIFRDLCNGFGAGTTELHVLRPYFEFVLPEYALALLKSERFINSGVQAFTGAVGQQRVGKDYITNTYFPLPPYAEQRRIVDRISKLFALIATIETAL